MSHKRLFIPAFIWIVIIGLSAGLSYAAQKAPKPEEKIYIPKEVKNFMQEGLAARQGRQDIPYVIFNHYTLPAGQSTQAIFLFKAKNEDLGFMPVVPPAAKEPAQAAQEPASSGGLQAKLNMFLQFRQIEDGGPNKIYREVYVPVLFQEDEATYSAEKESWYSTIYPLPAGRYLLVMALTTVDLKKVGLGYYEFTLPDTAAFQDTLDTTPIILVKSIEQVPDVETKTEVHKGFFTYSQLHITPKVDNVIPLGEPIEILFYVYGTKPNELQKADLEVAFAVKQNNEFAIRWEPQPYDFAMIDQPLPLKQSVLIKDDKGERKEMRDLPAGKYSLVITIKDKVSDKTVEKSLEFEVKS